MAKETVPTAPPGVVTAAGDHGLGELVEARKETNPLVGAAMGLGAGAVCYGLLWGITAIGEQFSLRAAQKLAGWLGFAACFLMVVCIVYVLYVLIRGARAYYVWSGGFVYQHNTTIRAIRWPEVTELRGRLHESGDKAGKVAEYQLVPAEGKPITVPLDVDDGRDKLVDALIAALRAEGRPVV